MFWRKLYTSRPQNISPVWSALLLVVLSTSHSQAFGQQNSDPPGIYIGPGASLTVGPGAQVSVLHGDLHVAEGATLVNDGELHVGRDLLIDGILQTTLGGTHEAPQHGRIYVAGDAEYRGSLAVALARGATFRKPQDFTIVTYAAGFGQLTARQLPGARWSAQHRDEELVVSLAGAAGATGEESFAINIDAAPLDDRVIVDWVVQYDSRTITYAVERYDAIYGGWRELGRLARVPGDAAAAYYSSVDNDLPSDLNVVRYRIRLVDGAGVWRYSDEVAVYIGRDQKLRVFPNPVAGTHVRLLGVDTQREMSVLRIIDAEGRVLQSYATMSRDLHLLELPAATTAGTYVVDVVYEDGFRQNAQLVVIR